MALECIPTFIPLWKLLLNGFRQFDCSQTAYGLVALFLLPLCDKIHVLLVDLWFWFVMPRKSCNIWLLVLYIINDVHIVLKLVFFKIILPLLTLTTDFECGKSAVTKHFCCIWVAVVSALIWIKINAIPDSQARVTNVQRVFNGT